MMEPMKMTPGFLSRQNNIFGDSNKRDNDQTRKKLMKMINGLFFRLKAIFTDNNEIGDPEEANNNSINSNINSTNRQTKVNKHKGDSKKKK